MDTQIYFTEEEEAFLCNMDAKVIHLGGNLDDVLLEVPSIPPYVFAYEQWELLDKIRFAGNSELYDLAIKLAVVSEELAENALELHRCYDAAIRALYRGRKNKNILNACIDYCKKDIDLFPRLYEEYITPQGTFCMPIHSVERLAIIYEAQGKIQEAIWLCEWALSVGINERECKKRLTRLTGKLSRHNGIKQK